MANKHLPQGASDWIGIAGFVLASLVLVFDRVDRREERPDIHLETRTTAVDRSGKAIHARVLEPALGPASVVRWTFGNEAAFVTAEVDGRPAKVAAFIGDEQIDPERPLKLSAVATNRGSRPLRFISATATYAGSDGLLRQETKRTDLVVDEERRRAVVEVAPRDARLLSVPLAVGMLDELKTCHVVLIKGSSAERFRQTLDSKSRDYFCSDPDMSRVIALP